MTKVCPLVLDNKNPGKEHHVFACVFKKTLVKYRIISNHFYNILVSKVASGGDMGFVISNACSVTVCSSGVLFLVEMF